MPVPSGMTRMLSSLSSMAGLDGDAIKAQIDTFLEDMRATAEKINANQVRIETMLTDQQTLTARLVYQMRDCVSRLEAIDAGIAARGSTQVVFENGKHTGVMLTDEKFPQAMLDDVLKET